MAAYGALVSLMNILHDIQHHPSPPISIHAQHLQSLTQILTSLQEFLESSKTDGDDSLEMRIIDAVYAAEDVIESHIVDNIHFTPSSHPQTSSSAAKISRFFFNCFLAFKKQENGEAEPLTKSLKFYQDLQRVIEEMDSIKQMAAEMDTDKAVADVSTSVAASRSSSVPSTAMVCSDAVLMGLMEKLTGGPPHRQVIPIVGMGGIGKTRNIYERQLIKEYFDICAWITVSHERASL